MNKQNSFFKNAGRMTPEEIRRCAEAAPVPAIKHAFVRLSSERLKKLIKAQ